MTHRGIKCTNCPYKLTKYPDCLYRFIKTYGEDCTMIDNIKKEKDNGKGRDKGTGEQGA